jgi:hypothetical protein
VLQKKFDEKIHRIPMMPPLILCSNTRFRFGTRPYLRIIIRSFREGIGAFSGMSPLYLRFDLFYAVSGFCLFGSITHRRHLYTVSFRLAVDTLAHD